MWRQSRTGPRGVKPLSLGHAAVPQKAPRARGSRGPADGLDTRALQACRRRRDPGVGSRLRASGLSADRDRDRLLDRERHAPPVQAVQADGRRGARRSAAHLDEARAGRNRGRRFRVLLARRIPPTLGTATNVPPGETMLKLKTATRTQGNNRALKDGSVKPKTFEFAFEEVDPIIAAFRRMVRGNEFDICEMAITTYICAKAHGKPMTAVPVFIVRAFHHGAILVNSKAGIAKPKDLEGKKVGVNRGYTVTTGVWARSILQQEHGVDLSKITWVLSGDEHVAEYRPPKNVVPIEPGKKMNEMLAAGELAAAIGVEASSPDVKSLIPDALEAGLAALRRDGHYPINHTVVIKDELIAKHPDLAADVFNAFAESKRRYVERLKADQIEKPTEIDAMYKRVMAITGDPLPYGIAPNRKVIDELIGHALTQGIISKSVSADELFAPSTRSLTA